jgi:hypothetical protein
MTAISDGVVIGIVLGLIFGAVCYYLFTRQSHLEQKVGLLENILLDLKTATEQTLLSATEPSEPSPRMTFGLSDIDMEEKGAESSRMETFDAPLETRELHVEEVSRVDTFAPVVVEKEQEKSVVSSNYESMTYKELTHLAKQRGITGLRNLSKAQVIEAIRASEGSSSSSTSVKPLSSWTSTDAEVTPLDQIGSAQDSYAGLASLDTIGSDQNTSEFTELIGSDE